MPIKLGFSLQPQYDRPIEEVISLLNSVGFSAVSLFFSPELDLPRTTACARNLGMEIQSLHAPNHVAPLWEQGHPPVFDAVMECIDLCQKYNIPTVVVHSWQGLNYTFPGEPLYYENYDRLVAYAQENHVAIAFENLEGEEYLDALMARYRHLPHVGFCWDSGHEHCYPHKLDFLKKFGDRLIMTHLNDNLGLRSPDGIPSGLDDLHYIPGDGNICWKRNLEKLAASRKQQILNFELKLRPDGCYSHLSMEEFILRAGQLCRSLADAYAEKTNSSPV